MSTDVSPWTLSTRHSRRSRSRATRWQGRRSGLFWRPGVTGSGRAAKTAWYGGLECRHGERLKDTDRTIVGDSVLSRIYPSAAALTWMHWQLVYAQQCLLDAGETRSPRLTMSRPGSSGPGLAGFGGNPPRAGGHGGVPAAFWRVTLPSRMCGFSGGQHGYGGGDLRADRGRQASHGCDIGGRRPPRDRGCRGRFLGRGAGEVPGLAAHNAGGAAEISWPLPAKNWGHKQA